MMAVPVVGSPSAATVLEKPGDGCFRRAAAQTDKAWMPLQYGRQQQSSLMLPNDPKMKRWAQPGS